MTEKPRKKTVVIPKEQAVFWLIREDENGRLAIKTGGRFQVISEK